MSELVLDTSVAIAWYLPEVFAEEARAWRRQLQEGRVSLFVPTLHFWEFANVLRTYVRRHELEADLAREIYDVHLAAPVIRAEPDAAVVLATALEYDATAYDAVFISLALARDAVLLTSERSTTPWVVRLGDRVRIVR